MSATGNEEQDKEQVDQPVDDPEDKDVHIDEVAGTVSLKPEAEKDDADNEGAQEDDVQSAKTRESTKKKGQVVTTPPILVDTE